MAHTHFRTNAIVLKKEERGEADQLFTVFTEDFGKIEVLGRAIRKITSKLRSGIDLFYYSEIEFIQGKNYKTLTDAVLIKKFDSNYQVAEAVNALVGKEHQDKKIFELLLEFFNVLNHKILEQHFFWQLFSVLGYKPELYSCAHCHNRLVPERLFFAPRAGGVVCSKCFADLEGEPTDCPITANQVKIIRFLLNEPRERVIRLKIESSDMQNLDKITENYFNFLRQTINPQKKH